MNISLMIDILGYIASVLILLSFMMSNPVKLRIIAFIGAASFSVYGFLIHSYPTAIMNAGVTFVNLYYLSKIFTTNETYSICKANIKYDYFKNVLNLYSPQIKEIYNNFDLKSNEFSYAYSIMCKTNIIGVVLGNKEDKTLNNAVLFISKDHKNIKLFDNLYEKLAADGYKKIKVNSEILESKFKDYIIKMGFEIEDKYLVKTI